MNLKAGGLPPMPILRYYPRRSPAAQTGFMNAHYLKSLRETERDISRHKYRGARTSKVIIRIAKRESLAARKDSGDERVFIISSRTATINVNCQSAFRSLYSPEAPRLLRRCTELLQLFLTCSLPFYLSSAALTLRSRSLSPWTTADTSMIDANSPLTPLRKNRSRKIKRIMIGKQLLSCIVSCTKLPRFLH